MKKPEICPEELRREGIEALVQRLGPVGMLKFLYHFGFKGSGDYTAERHKLFENLTLDDLFDRIEARKKRAKKPQRAKAKRTHS